MTEVRYEKLTPDRAAQLGPALLALNADSDWETWTLENLLADLPDKWQLSWLAMHGETPVGYIISSWRDGELRAHHMAVASSWRGQNVGRNLIGRIALCAKERGALQITAKVPSRDQRAIRFHELCGWQVTDTGDPQYLQLRAAPDDLIQGTKVGPLCSCE
jgi:GNAT superfamily N-acetyltransferase